VENIILIKLYVIVELNKAEIMKSIALYFFPLTFLLVSCSKENEKRATYEVSFIGNWKSTTHKGDFPPNAHFSKAVGMAHKSGVSLFVHGEISSDGIEEMAETGKTSILKNEIESIVDDNNAYEFIEGESLSTGTEIKKFKFKTHKDYPYASIVSMLAPSPDWFIAAENVELHNGKEFVQSVVVEAIAYDSGTDSGIEFVSDNEDTNPRESIYTIETLPSGNAQVVPFAWFRFKKVD